MLKKLLLLMALSVSVLILANAYTELNDGQEHQQMRTDNVGAQTGELTAGGPDAGTLRLSTSDASSTDAENEGKITLYGGEHVLKFSYSDLNAFEEEAKSRLGDLGKFGEYPFGGSANGEAVVYLDANDTILLISQNGKGALALIVSNDEEKERGIRKHSQSTVLNSQEQMPFEDVVMGLFNSNGQEVYIPEDYINDDVPVPKLIVQKQNGVAVKYLRADGFDYLAFGFGEFADNNMQEVIKLNGIFSGGGTSQISSYRASQPTGDEPPQLDDGPIPPVPELSTTILVSVGLIGLLGLARLRRD